GRGHFLVGPRCPRGREGKEAVQPSNSLSYLLFVQDHLKLLIGISAYFAKAVLFVEPLGRYLEDGGIQMQGLIAHSASTGFQLIQNQLAIAAPLIVRMDAHAFDLGTL